MTDRAGSRDPTDLKTLQMTLLSSQPSFTLITSPLFVFPLFVLGNFTNKSIDNLKSIVNLKSIDNLNSIDYFKSISSEDINKS